MDLLSPIDLQVPRFSPPEQEGDAESGVVCKPGVGGFAMISEAFSMVAGDDQEGLAGTPILFQGFHQLPSLSICVCDLCTVEVGPILLPQILGWEPGTMGIE